MMFYLIVLATLALAKCSHKNFGLCSNHNTEVSYDYILHVQTWAGQFCKTQCCDLPETTRAFHEGFTMHGWWPNFVSGYPSCCKSPYTDAQVSKLITGNFKEQLSYNWPSLTKCKFFNYEYDKHGTCLSDVYNGSTGPKDYATAAMNILIKHDMWKLFKANGVKADGATSYKKSWLKGLVAKEIGVNDAVYFTCNNKNLAELRLCTMVTTSTKSNPQFITCPSAAFKQETCGDNIVFQPLPSLSSTGCDY
ncbi:ribonuclease, putative [Entamoeba histolytica HM-1:IMSS-B]|nr:ribonuclease, putative [Entamoeba histolytica HM-1:IMSS-B]EMS11183.1 ribonuclease [Entamoeba histolytica HM-3:IMSS]GAT98838.1 ribonuclease putative [Entamoeba histolytica]